MKTKNQATGRYKKSIQADDEYVIRTSISLPPDMLEAAKERARILDLHVSQYIRMLLREDWKKLPTVHE